MTSSIVPDSARGFTAMNFSVEYPVRQDDIKTSTIVNRVLLLPVFAALALVHVLKVTIIGDNYSS